MLTEYLQTYFDEVAAMEFYRYIFPEGELDPAMKYTPGKYTGIAVEIMPDRTKRHTITDDLTVIDKLLQSKNFCLASPISYSGKARKSENARFLYAIAFDVDGIIIHEDGKPQGLIDLLYQINGPSERLPNPTFIVSSGTGLHLYYVLDKPVPLFKNVVKQLKAYKHEMTRLLWQGYITMFEDNVQQESIFQGFRMVGTVTKTGDRVRAFQTGKRISMEYMNSFVNEKYQVTEYAYKSSLTLSQAREKYPEWYQKRIVERKPKRYWEADRAVYEWWKREINQKAKVGHRYYCMMMLAVYARKCGISQEELETDAFQIMERFEGMTNDDTNHFDEADVMDALEAYNDKYITYPVNSISYLTDIPIEKNKRNGRKRADHVKLMNFIRDEINGNKDWRMGNGRPSEEKTVRDFLYKNPVAKKSEVIKGTGLSKPTVYKYYDKIIKEMNTTKSIDEMIWDSIEESGSRWLEYQKRETHENGKEGEVLKQYDKLKRTTENG